MSKCKHYTESIIYQLEQTARYCKFLGLQVFKKLGFGISVDEFTALDVIMQNDGICQRELAKLLLKDRANTGKILNALENSGYIKRSIDTKNNRLIKKVKLTELGRNTTEKISQTLTDYFGDYTRIFPEQERETLIDLVKTFRNSLEKEVEMKI